ncbi:uncharacterized protein LOC124284808 isoform X2 [Haliotis rubra]|uniref:uncharacterized protein LOC124284808 isoform X2 n=1 Tax=Haliotis rubra TaxID=36100 RepID=UPI001EE61A26|nr:uncharacterized protein LOC124284808 isoform X2 [Haliotis rubra]
MDSTETLALKTMSEFNPPNYGDERHLDLFLDFLLTVVLPSGIGLILAFCMAMCMCSSGSSREQYSRYESVRRASLSLRHMSQKRDTPLMNNDQCMTLDRDHRHRRGFRPRDACQSAPGTLQRQHRWRLSVPSPSLLPTAPHPSIRTMKMTPSIMTTSRCKSYLVTATSTLVPPPITAT